MKRQFFKTKEKKVRELGLRTRKRQAEAKAKKEEFLASPEGKAAILKLSRCSDLSKVLAAQVLTEKQIKDKMLEYDFDSLVYQKLD